MPLFSMPTVPAFPHTKSALEKCSPQRSQDFTASSSKNYTTGERTTTRKRGVQKEMERIGREREPKRREREGQGEERGRVEERGRKGRSEKEERRGERRATRGREGGRGQK